MVEEQANPYAAVLADLERQRDQILTTIAMIKRMMGLSADEGPISTFSSNTASNEPAEIRSDTFFGMSISDAIKKYLGMAKRPKRVSEIAKALEEGGLIHTSKNWIGTVQTTLTRMKGGVVKVPNGWGLLEWYPGRNFEKPSKPEPNKRKSKKTKKKSAKAVQTDSTKSVQDSSRQLQGQYLNLLKQIPIERREAYKNVAKLEGREKAITAMKRDVMMQMTKG